MRLKGIQKKEKYEKYKKVKKSQNVILEKFTTPDFFRKFFSRDFSKKI